MKTIEEKREAIIAYEKRFADAVSRDVVEKPKLTVWLILVPILFVFFAFRMNRYKKGLEAFAQNFLVTRERALDAAVDAAVSGKKPDVDAVVGLTSSPPDTLKVYRKWVAALVEHYRDLLDAEGRDCESLIKGVYLKRANYLLFLNSLGGLEKQFNAALKPHLEKNTEDVSGIIAAMERAVEKHRRKFADAIFPSG